MRCFLFWLVVLLLIGQTTQQSDWTQILENWRLFLFAVFTGWGILAGISWKILEREYRGKLNDRDGQVDRLKTELDASKSDYQRNLLKLEGQLGNNQQQISYNQENNIEIKTLYKIIEVLSLLYEFREKGKSKIAIKPDGSVVEFKEGNIEMIKRYVDNHKSEVIHCRNELIEIIGRNIEEKLSINSYSHISEPENLYQISIDLFNLLKISKAQ